MATSSRLAAHRANAPAMNAALEAEMEPTEMPDEDEDESEAGEKKDKPYMTEEEAKAAVAAARAEGFAEANARASTVIGSEHYAGREALAATLLANDKMSADEIVTALAAAPGAAPAAATTENDDEAARAEMRQNLAAEQPETTGQASDENSEAENALVANMKARFGLKD